MHTQPEDSVLSSSRREAVLVLFIWLSMMSYTVSYCVWQGYGRDWQTVSFVLGFPDWVFWGIVCPWMACVGLSWWFAYRFMSDESLGEDVSDDAMLSQSEESLDG